MRDQYAEIHRLHVELVAVSRETLKTSTDAIARFRYPFPIVSDPGMNQIVRYGVAHFDAAEQTWLARPSMFIVSPAGQVLFSHVGEHNRDRPSLPTVLLALEVATQRQTSLEDAKSRVDTALR